MFNHIFENWHFWQGSQFMASDESRKRLLSFPDVDACVNWLFVNGHKEAARDLNRAERLAA